MSATDCRVDLGTWGNPFSTRYIRPGALEFEFPSGTSAADLIARLEANGWRGEIVGPHGSGKSTLLAALLASLPHTNRDVKLIVVRAREGPPARSSWGTADWHAKTLVIVDGYEQFGWLSRRALHVACRRQGAGLLVTAHSSVGLPPLFRTSPSIRVLQSLVSRLVPEGCELVTPNDLLACYDHGSGNVREALFRLYDLYESRRRV